MGLILIYRTTRIVNFAYGAMGAMPGALTVGLFVGQGLELLARDRRRRRSSACASGALIDILVIRRFASSSRLVLTVATIGLAQILGAIGADHHVGLGADALIGNIETPIDASFFVRPYPIRGDHLLMIGVAPIVLGRARLVPPAHRRGRAVRAAAENQDRALLLGVPVRRLQTIVWAVAGGPGRRSRSSPRRRSPASCPQALVGADVDPAGPGRRGDRPVPVAADALWPAASASASPSGRSAGTSTPSRSST